MSELTPDQNSGTAGGEDDLKVDELALLKQRARLLGVNFSNNIGIDALREKLEAKMNEDAGQGNGSDKPPESEVPPVTANVPEAFQQKKLTLRQLMQRDNMRLVRIRVTNLDPKKKEWKGEILTVANEHLGTVTKFVPFGEATDNGYHVPYCIYKMLKARKFLSIRTFKDRANNNQIKVEQRWVNEFSIEVLEPLTPEELAKLAAAQTAGNTVA